MFLDKSQCIFLPLRSSNQPNWAWVRFFSENETPKPNVLLFPFLTDFSEGHGRFWFRTSVCWYGSRVCSLTTFPKLCIENLRKISWNNKAGKYSSIVFIWPPNNTHFAFSVPLNDREMTNGIRSGWKDSRWIRILKIRLGASPPTSFSSHFWGFYTCYITILICSS